MSACVHSCVCQKERVESNFSIDITDITQQAPNCLNTYREAPCCNKSSILCHQRPPYTHPINDSLFSWLRKYFAAACPGTDFLLTTKSHMKIPGQRSECWTINKTPEGRKLSFLPHALLFINHDLNIKDHQSWARQTRIGTVGQSRSQIRQSIFQEVSCESKALAFVFHAEL